MTGAVSRSGLHKYRHELEDRARQAAPGYTRAQAIRAADDQLRARLGDGVGLNRSTVSDWFVKNRIPQDFRVLWEFVAVLLEAAGARPRDSPTARPWWAEQNARCKGLWEAALGTRPPSREANTAETVSVPPRGPRVGEVDLHELGVHPAVQLTGEHVSEADQGPDQLPPYVPRDCDELIDQALALGGLVIVEGRSGAGKSRAAAESMRRVAADRQLLAPRDSTALERLSEPPGELRDAVVWLDDLERFCGPGGLDVSMLGRFCPAGRVDVVILATLRSEARRLLEKRPDFGHMGPVSVADVFRMATVIRPSLQFSPSERERANELRSDARIAHWLDHGGQAGLAEYLAAGPAAVDRWLAGRDGAHVVGAALVSAAVDCSRGQYTKPLPLAVLSELFRHYLDPRDAYRPGQHSLDDALIWATTPVSGASSCLLSEADGYRAFDYLVDYQQRNPVAPPIPDAVLSTLLSHASDKDFPAVFVAALTRSLNAEQPTLADLALARHGEVAGFDNVWEQVACLLMLTSRSDSEGWDFGSRYVRWLRPFAEAGNAVAMGILGLQLCLNGDTQQGEVWLRRSAEAGQDDAAAEIARLLHTAGRREELEAWLDGAVADGRGRIVVQFAEQLIEERHRAEAKQWYRRAVALGDPDAMVGLAVMCQQDREWAEAERLSRTAAEAGHPLGMYNLALSLMPLIGHRREAENWFRKAADAGIKHAAVYLAMLLHERGDTAGLDDWLDRERANSGGGEQALAFAAQLASRGDMENAERWYRHAMELGNTEAARALGDVLYVKGDLKGARTYYQHAADQGDVSAMVSLGFICLPGDPEKAERWFRSVLKDANVIRDRPEAESRAMTLAKFNLACLLDQQGKVEEAEHWYEQAAHADNTDAMYNLGRLLERQGKQEKARKWFRRASDLGDTAATNALWRTYAPPIVRPPAGPALR